MSIFRTRTHLAPLKANEGRRYQTDTSGRPCPPESRTLEGVHLAFNIAELLFGCWLCCFYGVDRLGSLVFRVTIRGIGGCILGAALFDHGGISVTQKYLLTHPYYCNTLIPMANVLSIDKQIAIIGSLAEGSSIRSIERMTGVHRDTIMRLGVKIGEGCTALMDEKMRNLSCTRLECDEIWGFVGKKDRHVRPDDDPQFGNVWTYCAIDADTKLVPLSVSAKTGTCKPPRRSC